LAALLEQSRPANAGVTVEQVRDWRQANDATACRDNLQRLNQAAAGGSSGTGIQPVTVAPPPPSQAAAPAATAQSGAAPGSGQGTSPPQVVVQQAQPNVVVRQQQPEVIVRIPPPVITVQQPQPEVIVRMPPPEVNVSVARPEVQVNIPQPQVQVVPPQQALSQPNVQVDGQQPNVRVERTGEPRIVYQQAEGQPAVRFESTTRQDSATASPPAGQASPTSPNSQPQQASGVSPQNAQAQLNSGPSGQPAGPQQTGAIHPTSQFVNVEKLEDMALYNARGDKMGEVEEVVSGPGNALYLIIAHGGFLGLGQKQVAMPIEQVAMRGDRLVAESLTDEQIRAMPSFDTGDKNYKEAKDGQTAPVRVLQ
jgi:PRC-barrel domain